MFSVGDKVVAINTDMSRALLPGGSKIEEYRFPDGVLRNDVVYNVAAVCKIGTGQGVFITGLRVFCLDLEISWYASRFRKVDSLKSQPPMKRKRCKTRSKQFAAVNKMTSTSVS
jgi:hypothetical protein